MAPELSVFLTAAYYQADHLSLRRQFWCLGRQTVRDFDVWVIDPHYQKRKRVVAELARGHRLDVKHIPYRPCTRVAKRFDWALANTAYVLSAAPRMLCYQCHRILRPNAIETILAVPAPYNVDLSFHVIRPEDFACLDGEAVRWDLVPRDQSRPAQIAPRRAVLTMYGHTAFWKEQWLAINGVDEALGNGDYSVDLDFDVRAYNAGHRAVIKTNLHYRLAHDKAGHEYGSEVPPDVRFTPPCAACQRCFADGDGRRLLPGRVARGEVHLYEERRIGVCQACRLSFAYYVESPDEYLQHLGSQGFRLANVLPEYRIGRNLRVVEEAARGKSLADQVQLLYESWDDPRYYAPP